MSFFVHIQHALDQYRSRSKDGLCGSDLSILCAPALVCSRFLVRTRQLWQHGASSLLANLTHTNVTQQCQAPGVLKTEGSNVLEKYVEALKQRLLLPSSVLLNFSTSDYVSSSIFFISLLSVSVIMSSLVMMVSVWRVLVFFCIDLVT